MKLEIPLILSNKIGSHRFIVVFSGCCIENMLILDPLGNLLFSMIPWLFVDTFIHYDENLIGVECSYSYINPSLLQLFSCNNKMMYTMYE